MRLDIIVLQLRGQILQRLKTTSGQDDGCTGTTQRSREMRAQCASRSCDQGDLAIQAESDVHFSPLPLTQIIERSFDDVNEERLRAATFCLYTPDRKSTRLNSSH